MNISLITIGEKMPNWVNEAYLDYSKRLRQDCQLKLIDISAVKRTKNADLAKIKDLESDKLVQAIPKGDWVVALEVKGQSWSTETLSGKMTQWMQQGQHVSLLIGGPEGMNETCRQRADQLWSLSPLTLPHPMVRVIVAEQLYRAWSIIKNHPYHR
ncbi:MAG: 23S rRNA (pseudouridine(1915)-N(3))-methyltransferase RlmH [Gammaproteobacteria bacterium]|nr:23S rRNA (pseudouridine(1915)-N(3))-methyltransferase RlmH [Gammaproteobacteria bacterium]